MPIEQIQINLQSGNKVVQPTEHLFPKNFTQEQKDSSIKRSCNDLNKDAFEYGFVYFWREKSK